MRVIFGIYCLGNIEVDSTWLKHTINNRCIFDERIGLTLRKILAYFIES